MGRHHKGQSRSPPCTVTLTWGGGYAACNDTNNNNIIRQLQYKVNRCDMMNKNAFLLTKVFLSATKKLQFAVRDHNGFSVLYKTQTCTATLTLELLVSIRGNFLTIVLMVGSSALSEKKCGFESGLPSICAPCQQTMQCHSWTSKLTPRKQQGHTWINMSFQYIFQMSNGGPTWHCWKRRWCCSCTRYEMKTADLPN